MKKGPGAFSLLTAAAVGFGTHLVTLCAAAWHRLGSRPEGKGRPRGR